jgi:serine/threonine-protein kinase HipA
MEERCEKLLVPFRDKSQLLEPLVNRSFLSTSDKRGYMLMYNTKRNFLLAG